MSHERIEQLVQRVRSLSDSSARDAALELVQAVMALHAEALERALDLIAESDAGEGLIDTLGTDPKVSGILLLHDLHPLPLEERVQRALDVPAFRAHGARVELLSISDGIVRVRATGAPNVTSAVERALSEAAPDAAEVIVEGAAGFVPLAQLMAG